MAVITTGNHPKALWPGVQQFWGRQYKRYPELYPGMFEVTSSKQNYEEDVEVTGFGMVPAKPEGTSITYDSETQGETTRYTHTAYALGYIVTYEELRDNLYEVVSRRRASALAFSAANSIETIAANVYNRGFNSSYTFGDAKEMLATDHPTSSGDQSNELTTAADLSEASLEDIVIKIRKAKNDRGLRVQLQSRKLIVPPDLEFEANRILKSVNQNDTANNAVNALRVTGSFPEGILVNSFLNDTDAWFVKTNCPEAQKFIWRERIDFSQDNDFDTKNAKAAIYFRLSVGSTDWRGVYGSPGA
jgi:hypothetical protein